MSKASARTSVATAVRNARRQKAVVEYHDVDRGGPEWWVMLPDGSVEVVDHASAALAAIQRAARRGNRGVTVTTIEWRDAPDGFVPPRGA